MHPSPYRDIETRDRTGTISRHVLIGTVCFAGVLIVFMVYFVESGPEKRTPSSDRSGSQLTDSIEKKRDSSRDRTVPSDEQHTPPPLHVEKQAPGTYRFTLSMSFPGTVPPSSSVSIALYRGNTEIDSGWQVMPDEQNRIEWSTRKGSPDRRLPPGLYRVTLTISDGMTDVPEPIDRYVSSDDNDTFREQVRSGRAWTYEIGVRVGSWKQIRQFERRHVRRLKRHGLALIDTWSDWRSDVQSAYERYESDKTVPDSIAGQLLSRLKTIQKRRETFLHPPEQDVAYLWTPDPEFKKPLRSFAQKAPVKMTSLTVTMLEQLIGGLPSDWPKKYAVSGFQSNIDVFGHMNQYHKRTVTELRKQVTSWEGSDERFRSVQMYRQYRLNQLVDIPEAIRQLTRETRIALLRKRIPKDTELRRATLRVLVQYARTLLTFHLSAYRDTIHSMSEATFDRTPEELQSMLHAALLTYCRTLYRKLGVRVPDSMSSSSRTKTGASSELKKYQKLRASLSTKEKETR